MSFRSLKFNCFYYFRGKGDYHRLGHGSYEHVRRPMRVTGMQGKLIVSIATGKVIEYYLLSQHLCCV